MFKVRFYACSRFICRRRKAVEMKYAVTVRVFSCCIYGFVGNCLKNHIHFSADKLLLAYS